MTFAVTALVIAMAFLDHFSNVIVGGVCLLVGWKYCQDRLFGIGAGASLGVFLSIVTAFATTSAIGFDVFSLVLAFMAFALWSWIGCVLGRRFQRKQEAC